MTRTIIIPSLSAGADYAQELIAAHELPDDLTGSTITLYCRLMEQSSRQFATALVDEIVGVRHGRLELDGAPSWFEGWVNDARAKIEVPDEPLLKVTMRESGTTDIWTRSGMPSAELADLLESMAKQLRDGSAHRVR